MTQEDAQPGAWACAACEAALGLDTEGQATYSGRGWCGVGHHPATGLKYAPGACSAAQPATPQTGALPVERESEPPATAQLALF